MNWNEFIREVARQKLSSEKLRLTFIDTFGDNESPKIDKTVEGHLREIYKRFESEYQALTTAKKGKKEILRDYLQTLYANQRDFIGISDRPHPPSNPQSIPTPESIPELTTLEFIGRDHSQPPTSLQNISTAIINDNLPKSSDQEDLEIDSSISSWVSEKSYNKFIARDFDLKKLIEYTEDGISSKVVSIWGMGGLGKTATCHRLISLLYGQKRFKKIVWINAKRKQFQASEGKSEQIRESRLDIQDAILDIGKELNLDAWFVQDIDRLQHEISKLFMQESHLLIVDGLEDAESPKLLISHLRRILGKSSLFLTSRKQISLENGFEYRLSELDRQSSYAFIQQMILEKCADDQAIGQQISQNIEKVITATHGMPLAMKLLVSQAKFLGLERVLERLNSVTDEEDFYSYLYWEVYQELCKGNQIDVLKILIFLSNQSNLSTPQSWLYDFDDMNKKEIDDAIKIMYRLSLIEVSNYDKEDRQINLHSFTAQYFRETLKTKLS